MTSIAACWVTVWGNKNIEEGGKKKKEKKQNWEADAPNWVRKVNISTVPLVI